MRCLSLTTDRVPSSPQHGQAGWGTALAQCKQTKLHSSGQSWLGIKPNQKACCHAAMLAGLPLTCIHRSLAIVTSEEGSQLYSLQASRHPPLLTLSVKPRAEDLPGNPGEGSPIEIPPMTDTQQESRAHQMLLLQVHGHRVLQTCPDEHSHTWKEASSPTWTNPGESATVTASREKKRKEIP